MKSLNWTTICFITLLSVFLWPSVSSATESILFFDDFSGTALDTSLWSVFVDIHGVYHWPYVADGLLHSQGYHTRIDSIPAFAPMGQSVIARARISLAGDYQKFGFGVGAGERAGPITDYYFDTLTPADGGREGYVRALSWSNPGDGSPVNLLDVEIPVPWYEFHEFAIERTPSEVIYSIDGQEVARVADAFAGALPVGVWNDRWGLMQTDWVEVASVLEPPVIEATLDIDPDTLNLKSKGKWITCYIELPEGYDVAEIDVSTIVLNDLVPAESRPTGIVDHDGDGIVELMVKFSRAAVQGLLGTADQAELTVTGELADGTPFEGTDTIRIVQ